MARNKKKKTHSAHRSSRGRPSVHGFYTPFEELDQHLVRISREKTGVSRRSVSPEHARREPVRHNEDEAAFLKEMADVTPLIDKKPARVPPASPSRGAPRFLAQEELEVYNYLVDLVGGEGPFELSFSDEFIDGAIVGLSPKVLKKLRNGDFSYQEYLDLHGLNRLAAREAVVRFVRESFAKGLRCILIIPGRGLNSEGKEPVLKQNLVVWLTQAPLKRLVLAFSSARSYDGGAGAFYVLLRRNEGKVRFMSPAR